ncbi:putative elongator complex protein 1 [Octopus bimaculoides]|uniref:Elongator complex protein 1 n=1 Tax=Octopus bimaculoides TaxID=37653 RepID=A0A0L8GPJ8_OCTBM|nr:putative elongator complex protein 1 [Octopus bimaculoides]|eukprot:XP_014779296.1 PREDICTED: putative elongator complex protein 1 [Octopus bimaculoides]
MKNLKLLHCSQTEELKSFLKDTVCITTDCDTGHVFCATKHGDLVQIDSNQNKFLNAVNLVCEGHLSNEQSVTYLQHLPEQQSVSAVTNSGSILLWFYLEQLVECVGDVEDGIIGSAWSPDQELLVVISGSNSLILMTRDFDLLQETALHPDTFGEAEFINVGWGKKETQFHGTEGKEAAKKKSEPAQPALEWDDMKAYISWRGDGQYFVTSTIHQGYRQLRVWTREAVLHSTSELVVGQEKEVAWKPTGSLIVSSQVKPNKHDIIFFEQNGLQHGEFTLPFDVQTTQVKKLLWNIDSTVLLIWCEELNKNEKLQPKSFIQLWTVNNYHWYLKQSLVFDPAKEKEVAALLWDPEQAYKLHIVTSDGCYMHYSWYWNTVVSDDSVVAVIDGAQILVTPMALQVVPPPMYTYKLLLPAPANQVFFFPSSPLNNYGMPTADIGVLLDNGVIALFTYHENNIESTDKSAVEICGGKEFSIKCPLPCLLGSFEPVENYGTFPLSVHTVLGISDTILMYCLQKDDTSVLCEVTLSQKDNTFTQSSTQVVPDNIFNMIYAAAVVNTIFIQTLQREILAYDISTQVLSPWMSEAGAPVIFPQQCSTMAVCQISGKVVILGLTSKHRLYINDKELANNCTSMAVHEKFLILTTLSHTCRFLNLKTNTKDIATLHENSGHPFDEIIRRVERGSCIVTVVHNSTKLVLQMPRGNLETVHPRALLLSSIQQKLNNLKFHDALALMRKHRINMNLAYDHNPSLFLTNIESFVKQVSEDNLLTLFLSELGMEDSTQTMYASSYSDRATLNKSEGEENSSKVNIVCDAIIEILDKKEKERLVLPILTAHIKKNPPEIEKALTVIYKIKANPDSTTSLEETLRHILCMVDINELYNVALGMYDFDIVLMVAEKSQKDPKEYLPFLNNLQSMEMNYQKFTIDKYLKRFPKALGHIVNCGSDHWNECLQFIEEHKLYKEALKLYKSTSTEYKLIASSYGDELLLQKHHEEAGVMYIKANKWENALQCFQKTLNIQQAMCMAHQLNYSKNQIIELCNTMAVSLKSMNRHQDAAVLYEQYVEDVEEAIVTLIEGSLWTESLRLMYKYKRQDFIETNLKEAILAACQNEMDSLENMFTDFKRHMKRLVLVRKEKQKAKLDIYEDEGLITNADLYSESSSIAGDSVVSSTSNRTSLLSRSTGRSSRNRRKLEKKKWSLKEGSLFEEFALVDELSKIIKQVDTLRADTHSLLLVLVQFDFESKAEQLQEFYDNFLKHIEKNLPTLRKPSDEKQQLSLGPGLTANVIAAAVQQGQNFNSDAEPDPSQMVPSSLNSSLKWKLHVISNNQQTQ